MSEKIIEEKEIILEDDVTVWDKHSVPPDVWLNPIKEKIGGDLYKNFFTSLSKADLALLVPISYRVGLWMSEVDDRGGDEADELEIKVLELIVSEIAEDFCKTQFIQILMGWTLKNRNNWENWHVGLEKTPEECKKVMWLLRQNGADEKDLKSFQHTLMHIAVSVAMAFREEEPSVNVIDDVKAKFMSVFGDNQVDYQKERLKNISSIEKKALVYLSSFIGINYKEVF